MMKKILSVLSLLMILHAQNVVAHGGGHGPISPGKAVSIALDAAGQFASFDSGLEIGKLSSSWQVLPPETSKIDTKGDGYYIVSVVNNAEAKTLYILMSVTGDIYDANFTGEFPKVK